MHRSRYACHFVDQRALRGVQDRKRPARSQLLVNIVLVIIPDNVDSSFVYKSKRLVVATKEMSYIKFASYYLANGAFKLATKSYSSIYI